MIGKLRLCILNIGWGIILITLGIHSLDFDLFFSCALHQAQMILMSCEWKYLDQKYQRCSWNGQGFYNYQYLSANPKYFWPLLNFKTILLFWIHVEHLKKILIDRSVKIQATGFNASATLSYRLICDSECQCQK